MPEKLPSFISRIWTCHRKNTHLLAEMHDDVIKWKHFPRYWPFVRGIYRSQRPVTQSFDVFLDLHLNKRLSKQSWDRWCETLSRPLWRHCNGVWMYALNGKWWNRGRNQQTGLRYPHPLIGLPKQFPPLLVSIGVSVLFLGFSENFYLLNITFVFD